MDLLPKKVKCITKMKLIIILLSIMLLTTCIAVEEREAPLEEDLTGKNVSFNEALAKEEPLHLKEARAYMVEHHLKGRDITDPRVLEVMGRIKRQEFVDESLKDKAYSDSPLPIGEGQTISQPYVVALMTQSLDLNGGEKVLEIGTGSGYQTTVLAELTKEVYTIEIRENLARSAKERLEKRGYTNVRIKHADGYFGWEEHAPYDAIMITAAVNHIPSPLIAQLKDGGKLILPLGSTTYFQTLTLVEKEKGELKTRHITNVLFVPLVGEAEKQQ